jgi:Tol biopolymer transport system component
VTVKLTHGIAWLPDASGFVVAASDGLLTSSDLYLVGLPSGSATALTAEADAFAYWPTVSPDGRHIAYTRIEGTPSAPTKVELRVMGLDGTDDHAIATDAIMPSWGRVTVP